MPVSTAAKCTEFRRLHESGCFVIPNPWDVGSARYLESLGFKALASSSAGFAWAIGRPDGGTPVGEVLEHLRKLSETVDIPVNADFEHGYSHTLEGLDANVAAAAETGICGLSIEDSTGIPDAALFNIDSAVERVRVARAALDRIDPAIMLIGRSEGYLVGRPDLNETIARLAAYADAGADCLFAPGMVSEADIAAVVAAVSPKPVNVVVSGAGASVSRLAALGVRRISLGGALARAAWTGFIKAAQSIAERSSFDALESIIPSSTLNRVFRAAPPSSE